MQATSLNAVQCSRTTKFPLVEIQMVGIDCSKEQLEQISMIWPTFINKRSLSTRQHLGTPIFTGCPVY